MHLAHPLGVKTFSLRRVKTDLLTELPDRSFERCARRSAVWLGSVLVINDGDAPAGVLRVGGAAARLLEATGDLFVPYRLVDGDGAVIVPAAAFFAELAACGRPATTQRSYGMDLLRWFRFVWALRVDWGSGDSGRGPGLLPLASADNQASAPALAFSRWCPAIG